MAASSPHDRARRRAMEFIAAYDRPDGGEEERRVARLARTWHSIIGSQQPVQGIVSVLLEEFYDARASGGCGWEDLRRAFTQWATDEEWLDPNDPLLGGAAPVTRGTSKQHKGPPAARRKK